MLYAQSGVSKIPSPALKSGGGGGAGGQKTGRKGGGNSTGSGKRGGGKRDSQGSGNGEKNYATLSNISQAKKCKEAGANKYWAGIGIKGYGKRKL